MKKMVAVKSAIFALAGLLVVCTNFGDQDHPFNNPLDSRTNDTVAVRLLQEHPGWLDINPATNKPFFFDSIAEYRPKDSIPPVITLLGGDTVSIEEGDSKNMVDYYKKQVTATDNSGVPPRAVLEEPLAQVDIFIVSPPLGTITYIYADSSGNEATKIRYVIITKAPEHDSKPPIISIGEPTMYIQVGTAFVDPGVSVYDERDGAIASSKVTVSGTVNKDVEGEYTLTYSVFDAAGNEGKATRKVIVQKEPPQPDRINPVITLIGKDTIVVPETYKKMDDFIAAYKDEGCTATDNKDGTITKKVIVGSFTPQEAKIWYITYDVTDAAGNPAPTKKRYFYTPGLSTVVTAPVIEFDSDTTVKLVLPGANGKCKWVEPGYQAFDVTDGTITKLVVVDSSNLVTNLGTKGNYQVTYTVTNSNKFTTTKVRYVTIVANPYDIDPPVITLKGRNPDTVQITTSTTAKYVEPGYTAWDEHDGDLTDKVTVSSTVKLTAIGTYKITYSVSDSAKLPGRATRTVKVVKDTTAGNLFAAYDVPSEEPLPSLKSKKYTSVIVDGDGPSVTDISGLQINWELEGNAGAGAIYSFAIERSVNPTYVSISSSKQTFGKAEPTLTISQTDYSGLNGTYYVTVSGTDFVWVEKTGKFALIWKP